MKDTLVRRFIKANTKVDNYRTRNEFSPEDVHALFDRGCIFPLIVLQHVDNHNTNSSSPPNSPPDVNLLGTQPVESGWLDSDSDADSVCMQKGALDSADSVYSQDSATREVYEQYAAVAGLDSRSDGDEDDDEAAYRSSGLLEVGGVERSVFEDYDDDGDNVGEEEGKEDSTDPARAPADDAALRAAAYLVLRLMRASQAEVQAFCARLHASTVLDPVIAAERARLVRVLEGCGPQDDEENGGDGEEGRGRRLPMAPWFQGLDSKPHQVVVVGDAGCVGVPVFRGV